MGVLVDALTDAFGIAPAAPAEADLTDSISAVAYWSFQPSLEVVIVTSRNPPREAQLVAAWRRRLGRRAIPLVLLAEVGGKVAVVGPSGNPPPVLQTDARLITQDLAGSVDLDPLDVRRKLAAAWERVRGAAGLVGVRNVGLFSTHFLQVRVPRFAEWNDLESLGREAVVRRSVVDRLTHLGFQPEELSDGIFVLRAEGRPAAAVLSYPSNRDLDRASAGGELPVATLLRQMEATGTDWGVLVSGDVWRIYSAQHPARMTSFVELDLSRLSDPGYFAALFSATALRRGGLAERRSPRHHKCFGAKPNHGCDGCRRKPGEGGLRSRGRKFGLSSFETILSHSLKEPILAPPAETTGMTVNPSGQRPRLV